MTEVLDSDNHQIDIQPFTFENIFSLGDACLTSLNEEKTLYPMRQCAKICAQNIKLLAEDKHGQLVSLPQKFDGIYTISLGPQDGICIINNFVTFGQKAAQCKLRSQDQYLGLLRGENHHRSQYEREANRLECLLWMCDSWACGYWPCSKRSKNTGMSTVAAEVEESQDKVKQM